MKTRLRSPCWRRALRWLGGRLFQFADNNNNTSPERNGEGWLLRQCLAAHSADAAARARSFVVFDAGANIGDYTRLALAEAARAGCAVEAHLFEPSPRCLEGLHQAFARQPAVRVTGAALSDRAGESVLFAGRSGSTLASLLPRNPGAGPAGDSVSVPLLTLESYVTAGRIGRIDLLKLDVEGSELAALRGLGPWLRPDFVRVIQFEYGGTTLDAGVTLRDFYRLLEPRGYVLAKLFPRAAERRGYRAWMENYACANYAAIAADALS
jgi:FkbM family methyltransferase